MIKNILILVVMSFLSITANAQSKTLICRMGDIADMDIKVESLDKNQEKLSVIVYAMDGETSTTYVNSHFADGLLSKKLAAGQLDAIVSVSDLQAVFGGAYLNAGRLTMNYNTLEGHYDVVFAAQNVVFQASCK